MSYSVPVLSVLCICTVLQL